MTAEASTPCPTAPPAYTGVQENVRELRDLRREHAAWCVHHDERIAALELHTETIGESVRATLWFLAGLVALLAVAPLIARAFSA